MRRSAERLSYSSMDIVGGARHDSVYESRVAPASMIFAPFPDGLSHDEAECAPPDDVAAGGDVLLGAVLEPDARS